MVCEVVGFEATRSSSGGFLTWMTVDCCREVVENLCARKGAPVARVRVGDLPVLLLEGPAMCCSVFD